LKITDVSSDFGGVRIGDVMRIQRSRTRWQRFKHWIWVRVLRRPDPDVFRITDVSATVLTLDGSPVISTGQAPSIVKGPP